VWKNRVLNKKREKTRDQQKRGKYEVRRQTTQMNKGERKAEGKGGRGKAALRYPKGRGGEGQ